MAEKLQLWHRQANESHQEYELFLDYLRERSCTEVTRQFYQDRGDKAMEAARKYTQRLKNERHWDQRCVAYDRWVAKQKDNANSEVIAIEIKNIARQRINMLRGLYKKVKRSMEVVDDTEIDAKSLYKVNTLLDMGLKMDNLWRKLEESNPLEATADKPFANEVQSASATLLALIEEKKAKLEQTKENKEILQ